MIRVIYNKVNRGLYLSKYDIDALDVKKDSLSDLQYHLSFHGVAVMKGENCWNLRSLGSDVVYPLTKECLIVFSDVGEFYVETDVNPLLVDLMDSTSLLNRSNLELCSRDKYPYLIGHRDEVRFVDNAPLVNVMKFLDLNNCQVLSELSCYCKGTIISAPDIKVIDCHNIPYLYQGQIHHANPLVRMFFLRGGWCPEFPVMSGNIIVDKSQYERLVEFLSSFEQKHSCKLSTVYLDKEGKYVYVYHKLTD